MSRFCFLHVWDNQATFNIDNLINALKLKIQQNYMHWWDSKTKNFSKLDFFNKFKTNFTLEKYLLCHNVDRHTCCTFSRFRISAHSLLVEGGRYGKLKRAVRCCPFCNNTVEDELHLLFNCSLYDFLRLKYFSSVPMGDVSPISVIDEKIIFDILQNFDAELTILLMKFINRCFSCSTWGLKS